jgi:hypothetical protein
MNPHEIIFMEQTITFSVRDNEIILRVSNKIRRKERRNHQVGIEIIERR